MSLAPKPYPCGSCPYRRDVPSGVWHPDEYAKLPPFDLPAGQHPGGLFYCHQHDESICSGWAGTHDMTENMGIRIAYLDGRLNLEDLETILDYESPVPLFDSGREAAEHGLREIDNPGPRADTIRRNLMKKGNVTL